MHCLASFFSVSILLLAMFPAPAQAEKRVALVIGNSAYSHAPKLPNPSNDASAVAILLKSAGFGVVETRLNLSINDLRRAIRDFSDTMQDADFAVVYYAGHGIEVDGINYLVPVDAVLQRDVDVEDETVSLERILKVIESAKRLRLVILDACRDNPFARTMKRTIARRAIGRGLASVEPAASDTLIAFAAKAGSTAIDGEGIHSPFTAAMLKHIATPGLDLRIAFGRVRDEVLKSTANKQEPFVYGSLGGTNVALVAAPSDSGGTGVGAPLLDAANTQAWRDYAEAAKVGTREAWDSFLATHPTGFYSDLARVQRGKVMAALPTRTTPTVTEPKARREPKTRTKNLGPPGKARTTANLGSKTARPAWCANAVPKVRAMLRNTGGDPNKMTNPAATLQAVQLTRQTCGGV